VKRGERVFPDTNVVIRYLLKDNAEQFAAAESFFEEVRIGRKRAVILESVIVECLYVLTKYYGIPRDEASGPLAELLSYKGMDNEDAQVLADALRLFAESRLDPVDCLLAARQRRGEGDIFTFDRGLQSAASGKI
jgi:predicted nucleic-acid-binding protein